jgi:threonine dehydratase
VIDPIFLDTPLYRCEALEPDLGCTVSIKLETANPVRSFKARGTEVAASLLADNGPRAVVCASAGNLGQALAWSGRGRGLDVTVVASCFATVAKLDRIRALDARLEPVDGDHELARERAAAIARYDGIRLLEDSLDIETCEGAATIGLELVDTAPSFDTVLIALGGGALATGVGHVVKALAPEVEVICVQPLGAPAGKPRAKIADAASRWPGCAVTGCCCPGSACWPVRSRRRGRQPRRGCTRSCPGSPTCPGDQVVGRVSTSPGARSVRWRTRRSGWR